MMEAMMVYNNWWWLAIPGILLGLYAQMKLTSTYARYSQVPTNSGLSGAEAAREILDNAGLQHMAVNEVAGHLTDHYDPTKKALFLSSENFHGRTIAAVGVAAHEAGHALQHKASYALFNARMALVPIAGIATNAAFYIGIFGMLMGFAKLALAGVVVFGIIALFHVVTMPVEFDASRRAKLELSRLGLVDNQESPGVSRVLSAAAMTYVATMVSALFTFLQFVLMLRGNDRD